MRKLASPSVERLNENGQRHQDSAYRAEGYFDGFGPEQQQVLMGSFLSTYAGVDAGSVDLNVFRTLPKPNWRVSYNGLARLEAFKNVFSRFSLTHSYKSSLTVNSYNTNLLYEGPQSVNPATKSYYARLVIPNLVLTEAFQPLIGIESTLRNDMSIRFSVNKSRNLGMSFVDNTLAERNAQELSFGYGYVVKNIDLLRYFGVSQKSANKAIIKTSRDQPADDVQPDENVKGKKKGRRGNNPIGNDLDLQLDVRFADDETKNRIFDQQGANLSTRGSRASRSARARSTRSTSS